MKTIEEIRLENLRSLILKLGGSESFSEKIGKTPNQVSQLANEHKGIGSKIAREIEEAINLDRGWMDNDHSRVITEIPLIDEKIYEAIKSDQVLSTLTKLSRTIERASVDLSAALSSLQAKSPRNLITGTTEIDLTFTKNAHSPDHTVHKAKNRDIPKDKKQSNRR